MQVSTCLEASGVARLNLLGALDMHAHVEFTTAWEAVVQRPEVSALVLDFAEVEYVDSSGLGMLLILHRAAAARRIPITLRGCRPHFMRVLRASNFTQLFRIEGEASRQMGERRAPS